MESPVSTIHPTTIDCTQAVESVDRGNFGLPHLVGLEHATGDFTPMGTGLSQYLGSPHSSTTTTTALDGRSHADDELLERRSAFPGFGPPPPQGHNAGGTWYVPQPHHYGAAIDPVTTPFGVAAYEAPACRYCPDLDASPAGFVGIGAQRTMMRRAAPSAAAYVTD